jgi:hypothetical protein
MHVHRAHALMPWQFFAASNDGRGQSCSPLGAFQYAMQQRCTPERRIVRTNRRLRNVLFPKKEQVVSKRTQVLVPALRQSGQLAGAVRGAGRASVGIRLRYQRRGIGFVPQKRPNETVRSAAYPLRRRVGGRLAINWYWFLPSVRSPALAAAGAGTRSRPPTLRFGRIVCTSHPTHMENKTARRTPCCSAAATPASYDCALP